MKTKNEATHTPTPWKVTEIPSVNLMGKRSGQATVTDSFGNSIAVIGKNDKADAAFIVRAVNSHEELIKALHEYGEHKPLCEINYRKFVGCSCGLAKAIANAEGE